MHNLCRNIFTTKIERVCVCVCVVNCMFVCKKKKSNYNLLYLLNIHIKYKTRLYALVENVALLLLLLCCVSKIKLSSA